MSPSSITFQLSSHGIDRTDRAWLSGRVEEDGLQANGGNDACHHDSVRVTPEDSLNWVK